MSASSLFVYNLAMDFDMTVSFDFVDEKFMGPQPEVRGGRAAPEEWGQQKPTETN